ncbi:MAG: hypothetical protein FWE24_09930 [Defluviitaleaceae bacterium]|nr:hypothetical protein [Defluviitaleaceae bacterium]
MIKLTDLSYKDTFNTGFEIYKTNIKAIALLTVMVQIPLIILERIAMLSLIDFLTLLGFDNLRNGYVSSNTVLEALLITDLTNLSGVYLPALNHTFYTVIGVLLVSWAVLSPLISSGSAFIAKSAAHDNETEGSHMLSVVVANIGKTTVTALLALICMAIGFFFFVIPGIFMMISFFFAVPAVIVTGKWGFGAIFESYKVVKGRWLKTFFFIILSTVFSFLLVYLSSAFIGIAYAFLPYNIIIDSIFIILRSILLSYFIVVECLYFVNKHFVKNITQ